MGIQNLELCTHISHIIKKKKKINKNKINFSKKTARDYISTHTRMSKYDFECQIRLFGLRANVKIEFSDSVRVSE